MLIALFALLLGVSIDAVALYISILDFMEVKTAVKKDNDFWADGACGAKNH